ncbi:MAG TPA: site-specific integrase [Pirellulales bacterium]|jgi:integrase/recombinase XerD|nr:site-specific integrase [Pirellulales bacterium]
MHFAPWNIDNGKILTRREMALVLADLKARGQRSPNARFNLILFRLAACCGLRVSEIAHLNFGDVDVGKFRPHVRVRPEGAKGGRPRRVPLWWDAGTLADIAAWKAARLAQGAKPGDPFLTSQRAGAATHPLSRHTLRRRFLTACRALGLERIGALTIHHGRHTFISHALAGGRTLAEVRDAAGHANVSVTSAYLHVAVDGEEGPGELFRF